MSERHLHLFENSPSSIVFIDEYCLIEEVNPAFCLLLGYLPEELLHQPLAQFVHPADADKLAQMQRLLCINRVQKLDGFLSTMLGYLKNTRQKVQYERVDLDTLIRECLADLEYVKGFERLNKHWNVTKGVALFSDPLRLRIIFQNLISNAIKYQNYYQPHNTLDIELTITEHRADFVFRDTGVGMTAEHIQSITKMFFRASDQSDGSGLGMYIVKQAVNRLGGQITIESPEGKGMITHIHIPNGKATT